MPIRAALFDLDETLVRDDDATRAAVAATSALAASHGVAPDALARALWRRAHAGWARSPFLTYFEDIGISPGECLWGRFVGEDARLRAVRAWAPEYQLACWAGALGDLGAVDDILAATLAIRFRTERRARHGWLFPETREALEALAPQYLLALVTNGASDIQRDKLAGSGLEPFFPVVQVSGEAEVGKPHPAIFLRALESLGVESQEAVMVGDNPARDVLGANRAGIRAVWLRRSGKRQALRARPDATIASLEELPALLGSL